jgi:hypothetical protein
MKDEFLKCPLCSYDPLDCTVEGGQMLCLCENCGYQKIEENYFYLTGWEVDIRQALAPVDILHSLMTNSDIVSFIKPRLSGVSYLCDCKDFSDEYFVGEISIAHQVYLRQMIVLATTYVELILKDFFRCLYTAQPQRMNKCFQNEGRGKGKVALNEVINAVSKEELMSALTERAAGIAVGPKFDKIIESIIKDCKLSLDRPLIEDLRRLNELRNRIIHQGTREEIDIEQVHNNFGLLLYLTYVLGQAAAAYRIPYLDETGFLLKFEKQLKTEEEKGGHS